MNNSWRGYGRRQDAAVRIEDIDELPLPAEDWVRDDGCRARRSPELLGGQAAAC